MNLSLPLLAVKSGASDSNLCQTVLSHLKKADAFFFVQLLKRLNGLKYIKVLSKGGAGGVSQWYSTFLEYMRTWIQYPVAETVP